MRRLIFALATASLTFSCVTVDTTKAEKEPAPAITEQTSLEDGLDIAIKFGGPSVERMKRIISVRKQQDQASKYVTAKIESFLSRPTDAQLINLLNLYQFTTAKASPNIFLKLVTSDNPTTRVLGWNLAANKPSPQIAKAIDAELSRRIEESGEEAAMIPQMANAVQANRVKSAYPFVREGLMKRGDESFAKAMVALDPQQASNDFMDYLSIASVEDLRQLNQSTVNVFSCMLILNHLYSLPPAINHPQIAYLFLYSVSRNKTLADLANVVLDEIFTTNPESMAVLLARLPDWIQVAYVDSARRSMTPNVGRFLTQLKSVTPYPYVVEEIQEVVR